LLCLLWDVPLVQQRRVVEALKDRSLVAWEQQSFWLHPVIRAVAIDHLRTSADWEMANRKAAEFWTASVDRIETVEDALKAFEAYHHYWQISDFEAAAAVILNKRNERLGRSFYHLGLFQHIIPAITLLTEKLNGYKLSGLYNLLGIPYRITGEMHRAIDCHRKAKEISDQYLNLQEFNDTDEFIFLKRQGNESLINIGLCQMQLGEIETALKTFEEVEPRATEDWKPFIFVFVAFLSSCLDMKQKAAHWLHKAEKIESRFFPIESCCLSLSSVCQFQVGQSRAKDGVKTEISRVFLKVNC